MKQVALVIQPILDQARRLAEECRKVVEAAGYEPRIVSAWELAPLVDNSGVHMAVTFGGDGTIIRAARWLAGTGTPILGVSLGKLGFMTELPPDQACERLPAILAGEFWPDERLMLSATVRATAALEGAAGESGDDRGARGDSAPMIALNDVVIGRGASLRATQIDVAVDGVRLVRYVADALVVATPTGSTAYALAAGGPVLAPGVQGVVVVPVAAHLAALRSLVVPTSARIEVRAFSEQPTLLVLDGQVQIPLKNGQPVSVQLAQERTLFARTGSPSHFYETLMESFKKR